MVETKIMNKIYGGLLGPQKTSFGVKVNGRDLFGKRRKMWGTETPLLLIVGPKWKHKIK